MGNELNPKSGIELSSCCELIDKKKSKVIYYNSRMRKYAIPATENIIQVISYCPWCGEKLPKNLSNEFWDHMEAIDEDIDIFNLDSPKIPEEFKSDEWWKKRGL